MNQRMLILLCLLVAISDTGCAGQGVREVNVPKVDGLIAIRGAVVHTMARQEDGSWAAPIADGVVLVRDGKIVSVGPASSVEIPDGVTVVEAAVVTPGLID
ncbi:MAG: hypothetical protein HRU16_04725, partial [Planctomycetes bacterium]|nr:hypothetical protein [Planctomycetota bacterium]